MAAERPLKDGGLAAEPASTPAATAAEPKDQHEVFLSSLTWWTLDSEVEALAAEYGAVRVRILEDAASGKSTGVARLRFDNEAAAEAFKLATQHKQLHGKSLEVSRSAPGAAEAAPAKPVVAAAQPPPPVEAPQPPGARGGQHWAPAPRGPHTGPPPQHWGAPPQQHWGGPPWGPPMWGAAPQQWGGPPAQLWMPPAGRDDADEACRRSLLSHLPSHAAHLRAALLQAQVVKAVIEAQEPQPQPQQRQGAEAMMQATLGEKGHRFQRLQWRRALHGP